MSRSVKKGPFVEKSLYKKVTEMNKSSAADKKMIKTYSRCSTIIPEMVGNTISVHMILRLSVILVENIFNESITIECEIIKSSRYNILKIYQ